MSDVRLFQDYNAIDSLRNSDFDALSAYGEVIDNSIEANAKKIHLNFQTQLGKHKYRYIERIIFGDDGIGMGKSDLHKCLQLGWSSRYNSRKGIGRFGVGMTLAAIHECKRVQVYSKEAGGEWLTTYVDLDEIKEGKSPSIPEPSPVVLPKELKEVTGDHGTVVVWTKYDRQAENADKLIENAHIWTGRTYRYFIWDGLEIYIDATPVKAIDPLYARTEKTRFPADPRAELFQDIPIDWPVERDDLSHDTPRNSTITIKTSLLPEEFRQKQGAGGSAESKARFIHMNEGVSILRNKREVFYGHIPYWKTDSEDNVVGWPSFEDRDRWWGAEIHFAATLDRAFMVKNIKRGAEPCALLKKEIKQQLLPTRKTCIERVTALWKANKIDEISDTDRSTQQGLTRPKAHQRAEEVVKAATYDKTSIDEGKNVETETSAYVERNMSQMDETIKTTYANLIKSQPFTIHEDSWSGTQLIEASFLGGNAVLRYNMGHIFFEEVYQIINSLSESNEHSDKTRALKELIDLMIIAHAKTLARFDNNKELTAESFIEHLTFGWGMYLQNYVDEWRKSKEVNNG